MSDAPFGGLQPNPRMPWYPMPYMQMYLDEEKARLEPGDKRMYQLRISLSYFGMFAQTENLRHPEEIERMHILRYQAWLIQGAKTQRGKPLSIGYQQHLLHGLRLWINWLGREGHITTNPWERIKIPRRPKNSKKLEDIDVRQIFAAHRSTAFAMTPFVFHRREAILAILFTWGVTLSEMRALNVPNMDMRQDFITIRFAKGSKARSLPYGPEMKQVIGRWLQQRPKFAKPTEDALLIDTTGERMSTRNIQKVLRDLGERAGVTLSPMRLRDTYGYRLLNAGMEATIVRDLLGLERMESVRPYDPDDPRVQEMMNATFQIEEDLAELLGRAPRNKTQYRRFVSDDNN